MELTGRIALDLGVAAATIANHPDWSIEDHAHRLAATPREEHLRPALLLAYRDLPPTTRRVFRLLGLFPSSLVPVRAAELLVGAPDPERSEVATEAADVPALLRALEREHLVRITDGDHVALHDAVAAFARGVVAQEEPRSRQQEAVSRLAIGYVEDTGAALVREDAAWLERERATLVAVAGLARTWDTGTQTEALTTLATEHFGERGYLAEAEAMLRTAIDGGGPTVRAHRRTLGRTLEMQGRFREAHEQLVLAHDPADPDAERSLNAIGNVLKRLGRLDEAIAAYTEAAALATERGNLTTLGRALGNLADTLRFRGDHDAAAPLFERALAVAVDAGDEVNQTIVVANTSISASDRRDLDEALRLARLSLELAARAGYEAGLPRYLSHLALVLQHRGETAEAGVVRAEAALAATASGQRDVLAELALQRGVALSGSDDVGAAAAFEEAIEISREVANPVHECEALIRLADLDVAGPDDADVADIDRARERLTQAAAIAEAMGLAPETRRITERLDRLAAERPTRGDGAA